MNCSIDDIEAQSQALLFQRQIHEQRHSHLRRQRLYG